MRVSRYWMRCLPASLTSKVKVPALPGYPFFNPFPWAITLVASPWKRLLFEEPGFFSTVSTKRPEVSKISEGFPLPEKDVIWKLRLTADHQLIHKTWNYGLEGRSSYGHWTELNIDQIISWSHRGIAEVVSFLHFRTNHCNFRWSFDVHRHDPSTGICGCDRKLGSFAW